MLINPIPTYPTIPTTLSLSYTFKPAMQCTFIFSESCMWASTICIVSLWLCIIRPSYFLFIRKASVLTIFPFISVGFDMKGT